MATRYVRSTDGSDADNGTTWALAKATLNGMDVIDTAGDIIYVSQAHSESGIPSIALPTGSGTRVSPVRCVAGNDAAEPPTALAGVLVPITVTDTGNILSIAGNAYVNGFSLSSTNLRCGVAQGVQVIENLEFKCINNVSTGRISIGGARSRTEWRNVAVKFANAGQNIELANAANGAEFRWIGGSLLSGGTSPTSLFTSVAVGGGSMLIEDVDFSNASAGVNIFDYVSQQITRMVIRNCKLPSSWSGALVLSIANLYGRASMYNCSAGSQNYKLWVQDAQGSIRDETTFIRSGGASDGTTGLSWKMVSSANSQYPVLPLFSDEIVYWNDTTGSSKTATVHILRDSATNLKDNEVWLEVNYLGSSGQPLGTAITDCVASVVATAADQASSAETWTTTGMSNPNKQKLEVTFTPQMKGWVIARVALAKASTTLYACPKMVIA